MEVVWAAPPTGAHLARQGRFASLRDGLRPPLDPRASARPDGRRRGRSETCPAHSRGPDGRFSRGPGSDPRKRQLNPISLGRYAVDPIRSVQTVEGSHRRKCSDHHDPRSAEASSSTDDLAATTRYRPPAIIGGSQPSAPEGVCAGVSAGIRTPNLLIRSQRPMARPGTIRVQLSCRCWCWEARLSSSLWPGQNCRQLTVRNSGTPTASSYPAILG